MRAFRLLTLVLTAMMAVGGCGWLFPLSLDSLTETRVRALCHFVYGCCTPSERGRFAPLPFADEPACVSELLEDPGSLGIYFGPTDALARDAIGRGAAEFDAAAAERCSRSFLDAINRCDPQPFFAAGSPNGTAIVLLVDSSDAECASLAQRHFTRGLVEDGDDCQGPLDCAGFGACRVEPDPNVRTVAGTCEASPGEGESCVQSFACQPGLYCDPGDGSGEPTCVIVERGANGEACTFPDQCESRHCDAVQELRCTTDDAPCVDDADCQPGDVCGYQINGTCADAPSYTIEVCNGLAS